MRPDLSVSDGGAVHEKPWRFGEISISLQLKQICRDFHANYRSRVGDKRLEWARIRAQMHFADSGKEMFRQLRSPTLLKSLAASTPENPEVVSSGKTLRRSSQQYSVF
ncbi:hypothetical protein SLEP1_g25221 [Rubroshorea leprosula]|uniref:MADF domain-containing protein n=1 Tax=Rubroshorea leprosula TaxID=152421 RepID=A0AAV5JPE6_9ROSI|nr:hypothetical protein SLEP1_g25221 [Rubroshorea leprosula]